MSLRETERKIEVEVEFKDKYNKNTGNHWIRKANKYPTNPPLVS